MKVLEFDHVGIRVSDRNSSLAFYTKLGFRIDPLHSNERVAEIVTPTGVRLNLIFNAVAAPDRANVLLDLPVKHAGLTHAAFVVASLSAVVAWATENRVVITEGPVDWGRRLTCFVRDPDGNVLEFNELKP